VQFPWRFGTFQALSTAWLVAFALAPADEEPDASRWLTRLRKQPALLLPVILLASVPALHLSYRLVDTRHYVFDEKLALSWRVQSKILTEYMPRGIPAKTWKEIMLPRGSAQHASLGAPGQLDEQAWSSTTRRFRVTTRQTNRLQLGTFYYPGWKAQLDGEPVDIEVSQPLGNISVALPAGTHEVVVRFTATPDRKIGAVLSGVGALGLAVGLALETLRRLRQRRRTQG
jgi:hypothetical protein